jgi:hypothetical protein
MTTDTPDDFSQALLNVIKVFADTCPVLEGLDVSFQKIDGPRGRALLVVTIDGHTYEIVCQQLS